MNALSIIRVGFLYHLLLLINQINTKLLILGVHSLCLDKQDKLQPYNYTMPMRTHALIETLLKNNEDYKYIWMDVCDDVDKLVGLFVDIVFDDHEKFLTNFSDDVIVMILAFLNEPLQTIAINSYKVVQRKRLTLILLNHFEALPAGPFSTRNMQFLILNKAADHSQILHDYPRLNDIVILLINSTDSAVTVYEDYYKSFKKYLEEHGRICYVSKVLENNKFTETVDQLITVKNRVVFLFGLPKDQLRFFGAYANVRPMSLDILWIFQDVSLVNIPKDINLIYAGLPIRTFSSERRLTVKLLEELILNVSSGLNSIQKGFLMTVTIFIEYVKHELIEVLKSLLSRDGGFKKVNLRLDVLRIIASTYKMQIYGFLKGSADTYKRICKTYYCPTGMAVHYGSMLKRQLDHVWDYGYGWTCRKCPRGTYKTITGNSTCIPCEEFTVSSTNRKHCVDPYKPIYLYFSHGKSALCLATTCVSTFLLLIILSMLFKYRQTPIGKSMDLGLMSIFLVSQLCNQIFYVVFFPGRPTLLKCNCFSSTYHNS